MAALPSMQLGFTYKRANMRKKMLKKLTFPDDAFGKRRFTP